MAEALILPVRFPGAATDVDLAVCGCEAAEPCPEDALVAGRILTLGAELGFLAEESVYLLDGRGRTTFYADGAVGLGTIVARTTEGYSGGAVIGLEQPLTLGFDEVELYPGVTVFVPVQGAVEPLEAPVVHSIAAIEASWDEATGLLALSTEDFVLDVTTGVVTVMDAAGQAAELTVFVQPGTPHPDSVVLTAEDVSLPADGFSTTLVTVTAEVPDGTPAYLFSTLGSFASYDLVLFDGVATGLFVSGETVGTATLLATVGSTTSAPLEITLE